MTRVYHIAVRSLILMLAFTTGIGFYFQRKCAGMQKPVSIVRPLMIVTDDQRNDIATCDLERARDGQEVGHNCKLAAGHTLDEVINNNLEVKRADIAWLSHKCENQK